MPANQTVRLQSKFAYRDPMLLWARARLESDRLELTGWHWFQRYRRSISIGDVVHVDAKSDRNLLIWLRDGEVVRLRIDNARLWRDSIGRAQHTAQFETDDK